MEKYFSTSGPVNLPEMYRIDPLKRWNLQQILQLIKNEKYFTLHAPRQTGKTSCLLALRDYLNAKGDYFAMYINVEAGQVARHEVGRAIKAILGMIADELLFFKVEEKVIDDLYTLYERSDAEVGLKRILTHLSSYTAKPIVLFIDEIDALVGDSLVSVLRQLRAGYTSRPQAFPSSVVLCGVRDMKDYRIQTSGQEIITGGSAFNIKDKSLRLGDFTKEEVIELYTQHTSETGQKFQPECFDMVFQYTNGQPWLVNAIAREVTEDMEENRDRSVIITPAMIDNARENIIISRRSHIEQLGDRLNEDRIRRVIQPIIACELVDMNEDNDDKSYCEDLGLIKKIDKVYQISNPIYREVIPRELTKRLQDVFTVQFQAGWLAPDGSIDITKLLSLFKDFWLTNSHIWREIISGYVEAAPQLVIQAFLQRVINGGGKIYREYSLGSFRFDIFITWDYQVLVGAETQTQTQKFVIELKTYSSGQKYETIRQDALQQTADYAHACGLNDNAHIIVFNRHFLPDWDTASPNECLVYDGVKLEIWKM